MRTYFGVLLLVLFGGVARCCAQADADGQAAVGKSHEDAVKSLLALAYRRNAITSISTPYHLVATFEAFTSDGYPNGKGSIERYVGASGRKTVVTFRGFTMTEYAANGKFLYTDDGFIGSIMSSFVEKFLFDSVLPSRGGADREMETSAMSLDGDTLDCGLYQLKQWPGFSVSAPKDGFCVSRATGDLILKQTDTFDVRYGDFAPFLDHSIARTITATKGKKVRCKIVIEKLEPWTVDDAVLTAPADASDVSPAPREWATTAGEVTPSHEGHAGIDSTFGMKEGPVAIMVLISRSGQVIDTEPLAAPSPATAEYSARMMKAWTYEPILRRGKPIEEIHDVLFNFKVGFTFK